MKLECDLVMSEKLGYIILKNVDDKIYHESDIIKRHFLTVAQNLK